MLRKANGELYKGYFRDGKRHGQGTCWFPTGCIYKGDWRLDKCIGHGTLFCVKGEILDCRFDQNGVSGSNEHKDGKKSGSIKILYTDGTYYEGRYNNHKRDGLGMQVYTNGDKYEGAWQKDVRNGRARMTFMDQKTQRIKGVFIGQFISDEMDGSRDGQYEENKNLFRMVQYVGRDDRVLSGSFQRGRLQNKVTVEFSNGDKFGGTYLDGKPNGHGDMEYFSCIPLNKKARHPEFEKAKYHGNFFAGRRDGRGSMVWNDGTNFLGEWKNDERKRGRMIMAEGYVYDGQFKNDEFHSPWARIYLPSLTIFEGPINQGKTQGLGMLLYPEGDIYYGMLKQFSRHGTGKLLSLDGSYYEGEWHEDTKHGKNCKDLDAAANQCYVGEIHEGKRVGYGRLYDGSGFDLDMIYEGEF